MKVPKICNLHEREGVFFCLSVDETMASPLLEGSFLMKRCLVAAALIVGFSTPVLAVETFYIMFDNSMKGQPGACKVMTNKPSGANYKMMGEYKSQADADAAMKTMKDCG
jgi:hypothetical protein